MSPLGKIMGIALVSLVFSGHFCLPALADEDQNPREEFAYVIAESKGVLLRVLVNQAGEENTDRAQLRFVENPSPSLNDEQVTDVWHRARRVESSKALLGSNGPQWDPRRLSPAWGWFNWCYLGWVRPYFYYHYFPTYYANSKWYTFRVYSYWNVWPYRYYYYSFWRE